MINLEPTTILFALPSWLVSLYLLRRLKKAMQAASRPVRATVVIKGKE